MFHDTGLNLNQRSGWIEIITGSMFSGKTEELILRLNSAIEASQRVLICKPKIDNRYSTNMIVSHNQVSLPSETFSQSTEILAGADEFDVVGIDEAQFFDAELPYVCNSLANNGLRVIAAGLDMDYSGKPFGSMPELMSIAESITKLHTACVLCSSLAHFSHRKIKKSIQFMIGSTEEYEPLCRKCYQEKMK